MHSLSLSHFPFLSHVFVDSSETPILDQMLQMQSLRQGFKWFLRKSSWKKLLRDWEKQNETEEGWQRFCFGGTSVSTWSYGESRLHFNTDGLRPWGERAELLNLCNFQSLAKDSLQIGERHKLPGITGHGSSCQAEAVLWIMEAAVSF